MSRTIIQMLAVKLVRAYKLVVSPWLPAACRFTPTCSEYAAEAIEQYGVLSGVIRAFGRLLRCHPLHRGGFDPVSGIGDPAKKQSKRQYRQWLGWWARS